MSFSTLYLNLFGIPWEKIVISKSKKIILTQWGKTCSGNYDFGPENLNTEHECELMAGEINKRFDKPRHHVLFWGSDNTEGLPSGCFMNDQLRVYWNVNEHGRAWPRARSICRMGLSK